jgi:CDP-diacylglycerol--serine O-phosphatidyltransferase
MVSSLPTYSWGSARIRGQWRMVALLVVGLVGAALFSAPWMTLSLICIAYAASIPFAIRSYRRIKQRTPAAAKAAPAAKPLPSDD